MDGEMKMEVVTYYKVTGINHLMPTDVYGEAKDGMVRFPSEQGLIVLPQALCDSKPGFFSRVSMASYKEDATFRVAMGLRDIMSRVGSFRIYDSKRDNEPVDVQVEDLVPVVEQLMYAGVIHDIDAAAEKVVKMYNEVNVNGNV